MVGILKQQVNTVNGEAMLISELILLWKLFQKEVKNMMSDQPNPLLLLMAT
jgi:hypothetical protein